MDVLRIDAEADIDPAREPVSLGSALEDLFSKWGQQ